MSVRTRLGLFSLVLVALSAAAPASSPPRAAAVSEEVMMLTLRNGSIEWGSISEHDPDGIEFVLLSNGGRVRVPWEFIDPVQESQLRERYGYVDVSSEELLIDAERIVLREGGEVVGVIVSREGDAFLVKTGGNLQSIPKNRVQSIARGMSVPALDVYSREEVYAQYAAATPTDVADAQYELAKVCERILDFDHAVEHYAATRKIDPDYRSSEVDFALERARSKAEQQEQIDYLRDVDQQRKKGNYDRAIALVDAFGETFPDSPLFQDAAKKKAQVEKARERATRDLVRKRWLHWMAKRARSAAKELTYAQAVEYAEEGLSEEIRARVLADVRSRISEDVADVTPYWEARDKVRYSVASYGNGTWLLGEEGARKGLDGEAEEEEEAPKSKLDEERAALEKKIKRFLENQERARKAKSRQEEAESQDTFWKSFSHNHRAQWIMAYYAEHSGDLEVRGRPHVRACPSCGGKGVREIISTGGIGQDGGSGSSLAKCELCRGIGLIRRVYFR